MKIKLIILTVIIVTPFFLWQSVSSNKAEEDKQSEPVEVVPEPDYYINKVEITEGSTYGKLMEGAGLSSSAYTQIFEATKDLYDLSQIRLGRTLDLYYKKDGDKFYQLVYQINTEEELWVTATSTDDGTQIWQANRLAIPYDVEVKTAGGVVESSMYESAMAQGIDERAVVAFANSMQWSLDFAWDVQKGDEYKFIYEARYRDGEYVMPGKILAGKFVNKGKSLYAFYYEESDDNKTFFDENGNSVQKMFLKAPVEFKYISSGFTTGSRYISAFNISTGHRAIDYAATAGTPIRSVGAGTVTFAGWSSAGYGYLTSIRHNGTYSTNYAHQSRIAVKVGQRVSQGQLIGYVGSTGLSTGPHLHYEMVKNGAKINPLIEVLPPGKPIKEQNKAEFFNTIEPLKEQLNS